MRAEKKIGNLLIATTAGGLKVTWCHSFQWRLVAFLLTKWMLAFEGAQTSACSLAAPCHHHQSDLVAARRADRSRRFPDAHAPRPALPADIFLSSSALSSGRLSTQSKHFAVGPSRLLGGCACHVSARLWPMPQSGAVKLVFFFLALSRFSLSQFPSIFFFTSISEMSKSLLRHLLFIIFTSDDTSHQILFYFYVMSVIVYVLFFCSLSQKNSAILLLAFTGLREDGWNFSDCVGGKHPFTASIAAKLSFRTSL